MKLFLVPTPVGNLGDMTYRAVEVLKGADLILAEDTRTSRVVMQHYGITTPMQSYHIHNEHQTLHNIIDRLLGGMTIALVTDAGTPGISDPGFLLIREAVKNDIPVETLPGATAFVPALVDSGIPCDRFVFLGFLPHKKGRQTAIRQLEHETRTMVIYESPFRLVKLLEELRDVVGEEREVSVSREISKLHAETVRGPLHQVHQHFANCDVKGEIVVVLAGTNVFDKPRAEGKSLSDCTMPRRENVTSNVFDKPRAEGKSLNGCTNLRRENVCCEKTNVFDMPNPDKLACMVRRENDCCEETND